MRVKYESCCGSALTVIRPVISFVMLVAGLVMDHAGWELFLWPAVRSVWYILAFLPVGIPVIREAWEAVCRKDYFSEFSLMLLATIGAWWIGEYPEAVAVILFYTVGELLQERAVDKAVRNISDLLDVRPEHVAVLREGHYKEVAPETVEVGEQIGLKPGGRVPLDGLLLDQEVSLDTSALTGESLPRTVRKGEEVLAGMVVLDKVIHLKVSRPYDQSALARILSLVKDAAERKAPAELFIRRFARIYTPIVILMALLLVLVPAGLAPLIGVPYVFSDWLYRGLVFLVISCPCALVVSVPLGYFAGIGAASRIGILFKGGNYLDAITRVNSVAFDKTGTLTTGCFEVTGVEQGTLSEADLLGLMLSVEVNSTHPIAQAVVRYARGQQAKEVTVTDVAEKAGWGVGGFVDGRQVWIGNLRLLEEQGIPVPDALRQCIATVVACTVEGEFAGALLLADQLKPDAAQAITQLKALGVEDLRIFSGDKQEIVSAYARKLGIRVAEGRLLPEDKAQRMEQLTADSSRVVAFVGDGMNDAPVLALSHVGIAMGGLGSDAAVESADVVIQTDQPSKVAVAIRIGRMTRSIVRQNIIGAIGVKVLVMIAGACGYTTLWGAVFADVGVALLAVCNALRIFYRRYE